MKMDRLIGILSLLLQRDKVTVPELAAHFEVSRRIIQRDIKSLCRAGIPIAATQSVGSGISILEGTGGAGAGCLFQLGDQRSHRRPCYTLLRSPRRSARLIAIDTDRIIGILLFSKETGELCFLAVDLTCRRQYIAKQLLTYMLTQLDADQNITATTYREVDPDGRAARAFYKHLGFAEGRLTKAFGH